MSPARTETAGTIIYRTTLVANPAYQKPQRGIFSAELLGAIRRSNTSAQRTVHFDGTRSLCEETNVDYGVRSLALELRSVGRNSVTYCKALRCLRFCVEHPIERPVGGAPAHHTQTEETTTIAGLRCKKAEYFGPRRMHVWYSEEVDVEDPTGAVLRLEGMPGLILQTEEIAESDRVEAVQRVAVAALSFAPPPPEIFALPAGYRTVNSIEVARAEDRRLLEATTNAVAPEKVVGEWLLEMPNDTIRLDITPELRFRTTIITAPPDAAGRTCDEQAFLKGNVLVVEDPPNDRYYELSDDGRRLTQIDNELFTFTRAAPQASLPPR
jgi:hypothetical protein